MKEHTQEVINLCKQIAKKHRKEIVRGDYYTHVGDRTKLAVLNIGHESLSFENMIPLWTISDCLEFFEKIGLNQEFNFKRFNNGNWRFTAEDNKYRKIRGEGETRLSACLKAVLAILGEGK